MLVGLLDMVRLPVASLFLIVSLVATVGFFILGPFPATACYLVVSALAVVAVPVGLRLFRPRDARPWLVIWTGSGHEVPTCPRRVSRRCCGSSGSRQAVRGPKHSA